MNLSKIDLNLFVAFDTIYTERNLTRASEVLNITQPAVSNALSRLRVAFDDQLFVRAGHAMNPTPVAQTLIAPVRQALRTLRESIDQLRSFDAASSEKIFTISLGDGAASMLMPELAASLRKVAPRVKVHSVQIDRRDIPRELASGNLDFAIDIPQVEKSELNAARISADRYVCVLRKDHPLAKAKLTLDGYLTLDHVAVSSRRRGRGLVDIALGRLGRQANTVMRVMHFQPALHVVMNTDMAVSAPLHLAARYDVAIRELPFPSPELETMLYWHRNADRDPANVWMREQLIAAGRRQQAGEGGKSRNRGLRIRKTVRRAMK